MTFFPEFCQPETAKAFCPFANSFIVVDIIILAMIFTLIILKWRKK
jgi:hypothetical protein